MKPWRWHFAGCGRTARFALTAGCLSLGAAMAQGANPWTPPAATPPAVYPSDLAAPQAADNGWGAARGPSLYAPPDLDARLSGATVATPQPAPAPAPQPPVAMAPAPPVGVPGVVTPVVPGVATYPGALPYGAAPVTGVSPVVPGYGYGATAPYGTAPGYGAGWPGYAPGWGYGGWPGSSWGSGWPGMGVSPFGFW